MFWFLGTIIKTSTSLNVFVWNVWCLPGFSLASLPIILGDNRMWRHLSCQADRELALGSKPLAGSSVCKHCGCRPGDEAGLSLTLVGKVMIGGTTGLLVSSNYVLFLHVSLLLGDLGSSTHRLYSTKPWLNSDWLTFRRIAFVTTPLLQLSNKSDLLS